MYLKSIEVQGFKSFANKILFEFHDGITGIVGPNGSGKSNVADAVRWVLGEQSAKQLRGGNMQDVIFAGTENRSPQSYAKVTINLDNSDHTLDIEFDEVAVTRKLYRSGESEYLLNNSPCRLKDIQELFYDTGIGKEGYSIIGQGQIDKILSGKPEERRELFDEAAGIVKFKRRKNQTQKKLENERANITRVNDILEELERQVGPLSRQAEKAKLYLAYRDELKSYDINMFLLETDRVHNDIEKLKNSLTNTTKELEDTILKLDSSKEDYAIGEEEIESLSVQIEDLKNKQAQTALLKEQIEGQIKVIEEQIKNQDIKDANFSENAASLKSEIDKRNKEKQKLEYENKELKDSVDKSSALNQELITQLEDVKSTISETKNKIESKKTWVIEELSRRAAISGNNERYDVLLEQNKKQKSEINRRLIAIKSEEQTYEADVKEKTDAFIKATDDLKEKSVVLKGQQDDFKVLTETISKLEKKYDETNNEYITLKSKLESLKNMAEHYDGYGHAIKRVMEKKDSHIHGVVADVIKVNKEHEIAIETALAASIQNIVVDSEEDAKKMISYLKENKFGRATFLPLSSVKANKEFAHLEALNDKGAIGLANTLVKTDRKYENIIKSLLGRILVVDNIDNAIFISKKYSNKFQIVTLDGENLKPGGSITGGSFKYSSNLLSKQREIENLEKEVVKLEKETLLVKDNKDKAISSKDQANRLIIQISHDIQKLEIKKHELQLKLEDSKLKLDKCVKEIEDLKNNNSTLDEQVEEIKQERLRAADLLEVSIREEKENNTLIEVLEKELVAYELKESKLIDEQAKTSLNASRLEQKYAFIMDNTSRLESEIQDYELQLKTLIDNNTNSASIRDSKNEEIEKLKNSINDSLELVKEFTKEIESKEKEKEELNKSHKDVLSKRDELLSHNNELDKEKFRLESKLESMEESMDKYINYMWEEYELTYDSAIALRNNELNDVSFMRRRINELKRDIRNLGAININAIEDYKNIGERYEFLKAQRDDLQAAEASLINIIAELDNGMIKQFNEQFKAIDAEYNKVFKQLFGGGKGYIELTDPDDVLETGIRIIAQPPGKKLQNMMQLSGGEKALTAIALLFAIQNLKPSPFCLLDEIEAALDDSNVDKFADYLHAMTKNTQFIVITHRRGTMTSADRLYGITMQEKGVSALVSVDLVEKELDD